jgi:hypothetical protein
MMRRITSFVTLAVLVLGATQLMAHDEFRIIGTVTKRQDSRLEVKTKEGKTIPIGLNTTTTVWRNKKKVATTELKVGQSVVIDALGDSYADLVAFEVRIVPSITSRPTK